jgi:hypothetical protein
MFILGGLGQRWDIQHAPFMQYPRSGGPWSVTRHAKAKKRLAAKQKYLEWVEQTFPEGFEVARVQAESKGLKGLGQRYDYRWTQDMNVRMKSFQGLGQTPTVDENKGPTPIVEQKPWYEKSLDILVDSVNRVVPEYIKYQTDKQLLDINLKRMRQGLLPAEGEFATGSGTVDSTPVPSPFAPQTPAWLVPAALGVGLLVLMMPRR